MDALPDSVLEKNHAIKEYSDETKKFLTSKDQLREMAPLSLRQRVKMFNMTFDDIKLTYHGIRKIFRENNIERR